MLFHISLYTVYWMVFVNIVRYIWGLWEEDCVEKVIIFRDERLFIFIQRIVYRLSTGLR